MIGRFFHDYSKRARYKRNRIFNQYLAPSQDDNILDLGSEDGSYIASIVPYRDNVYIADFDQANLEKGRSKYGFQTVLLDERGKLPFQDNFFDIVFCSSVIEHVTVDKKDLYSYQDSAKFCRCAYRRQIRFAREIRRVGKKYFVQTPDKYFLVESHSWMPVLIVFLHRKVQIKVIDFVNRWWVKKTAPDWNLLTPKKMQKLFPDAEIVLEKSFGMTKSIMAIKH